MGQAAIWGEVANAALQVGTAWVNQSSQHKANRMNLQIAREQQKWEERMSNTAVQRRVRDIQQAGGNPALAFTNGQEATTPTYTPARMEAVKLDSPRINTGALLAGMLTKSQILNMSAQTRLTTEQARLAEEQQRETRSRTLLNLTTGSQREQEIRNLETTNRKIEQEIQTMATERAIKEIQLFVASHTREEAIEAIKNNSIITKHHVDTEGFKSDWALIKRTLLRLLDADTGILEKD